MPFFSIVASSASITLPRLHSAMNAASAGIRLRRVYRQRVLGRDRAEGHAHDRVGAGGEDVHAAVADRLAVLAPDVVREGEAHALALADPVRLHRAHALGPAVHPVEIVEQLVGVVGDPQVVHRDLALFDQRVGAPAAAVDHLLVGEHGLVDRVPVDDAGLLVGDALFQHLQEQPLVPAVVLRLAGRDLARPVDCQADAPASAASSSRCCRRSTSPAGRRS